MIVQTSAPSNIALIKYMGKTAGNQPVNSSLSWTLEGLRTFVKLTLINSSVDEWRPLLGQDLSDIHLTEKSRMKFLSHLGFLKEELGLPYCFLVESANNFPSDCGLASSASSFAALTMAANEMATVLDPTKTSRPSEELAKLSQRGSGSSCRSFFSPWSLWTREGAKSLELPIQNLLQQVVVVESGKKLVPSSEAHQRVSTSELFLGRPERAETRLLQLLTAFRTGDWQGAYEICWSEFWDMHALFETSRPGFGYMKPETLAVLEYLRNLWNERQDGPLITMDAGANVHALYRPDQLSLALQVRDSLTPKNLVIMSGIRS